jgi:hypothetical protein
LELFPCEERGYLPIKHTKKEYIQYHFLGLNITKAIVSYDSCQGGSATRTEIPLLNKPEPLKFSKISDTYNFPPSLTLKKNKNMIHDTWPNKPSVIYEDFTEVSGLCLPKL